MDRWRGMKAGICGDNSLHLHFGRRKTKEQGASSRHGSLMLVQEKNGQHLSQASPHQLRLWNCSLKGFLACMAWWCGGQAGGRRHLVSCLCSGQCVKPLRGRRKKKEKSLCLMFVLYRLCTRGTFCPLEPGLRPLCYTHLSKACYLCLLSTLQKKSFHLPSASKKICCFPC